MIGPPTRQYPPPDPRTRLAGGAVVTAVPDRRGQLSATLAVAVVALAALVTAALAASALVALASGSRPWAVMAAALRGLGRLISANWVGPIAAAALRADTTIAWFLRIAAR